VLCIGAVQKVWDRTQARPLPLFFTNKTVTVFGATITWDNVLQIVLAVAVAIALRALLYSTRTGTAMRAVVDNPGLAALNGASPVTTARVSWILGTELAVVAGILFAAGTPLEPITLTFFVVNAYGAAVFGKLRNLPLTFAGGMVLGLVEQWGRAFTFPSTPQWFRIGNALPGLFLFVCLLALPQARLTAGRIVGRRAPATPGPRSALVRAGGFLAFAAVFIRVLPEEYTVDSIRALVLALLLLSLVVLTGFSGQVSLAQYVLLAIGAWAMGDTFGGDSMLGILAAGIVAVPIGAIVALPALRLQGLYLALVTFGFAALAESLIIGDPRVYGAAPVTVGRPSFLGIDFAGDQAYFMLCATVFALLGLAVLALKRGPFGRRLAAMRDSQIACATLGLDTRRTKLAVFCVSAFIAGIAGALFGGLQASVSAEAVTKENNIVLFLFAVVGGVTTVSGALLGGSLFALMSLVESKWPEFAGIPFVVVAAGAVALGRQPNGLAGIVYGWFDGLRGRRTSTPARRVERVAGPARVGDDGGRQGEVLGATA
jgi:branched-chain amino acid transport system permease protein